MNPLETLAKLMDERKEIKEQLKRLQSNRGFITDGGTMNGWSKNKCTKLELYFGAHVHINDKDLNVQIVELCVEHLTTRLGGIETLIGLAERLVSKEIGTDLLSVLEAHINAGNNRTQGTGEPGTQG